MRLRVFLYEVFWFGFLFLGLSPVFPLHGQASEYLANLTRYNVEDGLLHREVNAITEDCDGFIWLATNQGLNRFDGHQFKKWTQEANGLLTNHIGQLIEDAQGYLWLIPFEYKEGGDFSLLNHHTGAITTLEKKYGEVLPFPVENVSFRILTTRSGEVIFGSQKDGFLVRVDTNGLMHHYELPFKSLEPGGVTKENEIWAVADKNKLVKLDLEGKILSQVTYDRGTIDTKYLFLDAASMPYFRGGGNYYFGLDKQGQLQRLVAGMFPVRSTWERQISGIVPFDFDKNTNWIFSQDLADNASSDGVVLLNHDNEILFSLLESFPELEQLGVRCMYVDSGKRTWIGGNFGVSVLDVHPNNFRTYLTSRKEFDASANLSCRGLLKEDNYLYVTLESMGFYQVDLETGKPKLLLQKKSLTNNGWYFDLVKGPEGKLWIGSLNTIYTFDPVSGATETLDFNKGKPSTVAWELYFDQNQRLWVGTEKGFWILEKGQKNFRRFDQLNQFTELDDSHILFIHPNDKGNLLACSNKGIFEIDPDKGVIDRYWTEGDTQHHLPHDNIQHFYQDEQGIYWLSTGGSGLIRWDKRKGFTRVFDKSAGLSNEVIYAAYPDQYGNLWLSSDYGIIRFNKENFSSVAFVSADGTSHHEFNRISHFQDKKGEIFFGSLTGITEVDPANFMSGQFNVELPLIVTDFQRFEGKTDRLQNRMHDLLETNQIVLRPSDRFFRIDFALLNFMNMERVNYAYKLEGIDKDWVYQKENYIRFSGLPYGRHVLHIKGQMPNGQWSRNELKILVVVPKPFYLRGWFLTLMAAILVVLGSLVYFWQTRQLKERQLKLEATVRERTIQIRKDKQTIEQQAEELRQLDQFKSRFFANVSHELRTPLTLMLGPIGSVLKSGQMDERNRRFLKTAQRNGKNLPNLVSEILDLSKLESGDLTVNEEPVKMSPLIKRLNAQYESYAEQRGIKVTLKYHADEQLELLIDANKFEKIFNNLLSNALKFTGEGGRIEVVFEDKFETIELSVFDTGSGIHPDDLPHVFNRFYQSRQPDAPVQGGTGIGLALCLELAHIQGGDLKVESEFKVGTMFTLELPRKQVETNTLWAPEPDLVEFIFAEPWPDEIMSLPGEGKKPTLLIVEDNVELRDYIKQVLSLNYAIETASNGSEALEKLNREGVAGKTDLIISDVMMPVMDGFELLEKLKSNDLLSGIPVVMLTARAALHDKLKALRIGVDDYMLKPFEEEELLARVGNLIKNYREREKTQLEAPEQEKYTGISGEDRSWLEGLEAYTQKNAGHFNLTAEMMADEMALSRTQLFRKIKQLTGLTPTQYVQEVRFSQARTLLENRTYSTVKSVAYEVGYKQVKHFSQQFKKRFGKSPSDYLK